MIVTGMFSFALKKHTDSATSTSETSENVFVFVFISFVSFRVCIYLQYFFEAVRNQTENIY